MGSRLATYRAKSPTPYAPTPPATLSAKVEDSGAASFGNRSADSDPGFGLAGGGVDAAHVQVDDFGEGTSVFSLTDDLNVAD